MILIVIAIIMAKVNVVIDGIMYVHVIAKSYPDKVTLENDFWIAQNKQVIYNDLIEKIKVATEVHITGTFCQKEKKFNRHPLNVIKIEEEIYKCNFNIDL
eukprot:NODE_1115_length_2142_cov_0.443465.p2 type:complete len:100 gc:universal NODE_1115_length_2142_cov_0.443465:773-474(-)